MIRLTLLLMVLATPALAISDPREMLPNPAQEARAEAIGSQLRCLVCQNESIEDSQAQLAADLRAIVREHVAAGETNAHVVAWLVARYGQFIRLRPPFSPVTALLYLTPVLTLLAGFAAFWRRRPGPGPAPLTDDERRQLAELT